LMIKLNALVGFVLTWTFFYGICHTYSFSLRAFRVEDDPVLFAYVSPSYPCPDFANSTTLSFFYNFADRNVSALSELSPPNYRQSDSSLLAMYMLLSWVYWVVLRFRMRSQHASRLRYFFDFVASSLVSLQFRQLAYVLQSPSCRWISSARYPSFYFALIPAWLVLSGERRE